MIPVLFKKDEQQFRSFGLGELSDFLEAPEVKRERNGQYTFYMRYAIDGLHANKLEEGMKIKSDAGPRTKWQTFEINRIVKSSNNHIDVYANHISMRTMKDVIRPQVIGNGNGQQLLQLWRNNLVGDDYWDVWSDIVTPANVNWSIEQYSTARQALGGVQGSILDVLGGEYEFDNKTIRLWREMGRTAPTVLEYGRNIISAEKESKETTVYTSVYPFATHLVEGTDRTNLVALPEFYIDSDYIDMYDHRKVLLVDFTPEFGVDNIPTVSRLRTLAQQYIVSNQVGSPWENIKVEYQDLSKTLDYKDFQVMEEVELNDVVPVFYPKLTITNSRAKVVVTVYNPVKEEYKSVELGVVGQRMRNTLNGNIDQRLDKIEKEQLQQHSYIINAAGNRVWYSIPPDGMEHKDGDLWFEENGQYTRIRMWNGSQWLVKIDTEDIDKNAKAIEEQRLEIDIAKESAEIANQQINDAVQNAGFTSLPDLTANLRSISESAQSDADDALSTAEIIQNIVYDPDTGLASVNTQLSNLIQVAVTGDELSNALSLTETNILAQTVSNGEVVAQINQEAGRTLISNGRLDLDADTVAFSGSAFIPSAAIASLSADKITTGELNAALVNIVGMNASSIVTGTLEGINITGATINGSIFNQVNPTTGSTVGRWDRFGIAIEHPDGSLTVKIDRTGILLDGTSTTDSATYLTNRSLRVMDATIYNLQMTGTARTFGIIARGNIDVGHSGTGVGHGIRFVGQQVPSGVNRLIWAGWGYAGNGVYVYFNGAWNKLATESSG